MKKLPRSFYLRPTITVAKNLLGKHLVRIVRYKKIIGRIVVVEAYLGARDPASHAYRGKTKRKEVMFWEGGHLYVYFTYGVHFCANVVTEDEGIGHAVLLRAVEPAEGIDIMKKNRRFTADHVDERMLTNGPAKLCQAFRIGRAQNGVNLLGKALFLAEGKHVSRRHITASTRIGVTRGADKRWRFYISGNAFVSKK